MLALLLAGAFVTGGLAGWRELSSAEWLRVRSVRFSGLVHASEEDLLGLSPVRAGDHLLFSDLDAMQRALVRHPWVRAVEVHRTLPPSIRVSVSERTAVALVDLGGTYLVDAEGEVFKRAAPGDGLDLPFVTGLTREEFSGGRGTRDPSLGRALALIMAWPGGDRTRLSEVHVEGDDFTVYIGEEGAQVRLGSGDLPAKLARLEKVLGALRAEGKKAEVLHLDNRLHPSWVTVRLAAAGVGSGSPNAQGQASSPGRARTGSMGRRGPAPAHH